MRLIDAMLEETSEVVFFNPAKIIYAKNEYADGEVVYTDILLEDGTKLYRTGSVKDLNDEIKDSLDGIKAALNDTANTLDAMYLNGIG